MIETTSTIPKKMEKMLITFSDKFGWCKYTPNHTTYNSTASCTECTKEFYGLDAFTVLTLHTILFHEREDKVG